MSARTIRRLAFAAVAGLLIGAAPSASAAEDGARDVVVATKDGMKLAGTLWSAPTPGGAGVVLLHMEKSDRSAWAPLVPHLRARGLSVLSIDLRGHGGSVKQTTGGNLAQRVEKKDPRLFADMHQDAVAALRFLVKEGKCDGKRVALVGAGVGCSIAIDAARRYPGETAAVLGLSPSSNTMGLDSLDHAKTFPAGEPLLLLVHKDEADGGAAALRDAVPSSGLVVYDDAAPASAAAEGKTWAHGTKMFGRLPLVEQTAASFVAARTGSKTDDVVLDGIIAEEGTAGGAWTRATKVSADGAIESWAYRVGMRVEFGGRVRGKAAAVYVGMATHFVAGTFPGIMTDPAAGMPEVAAIDAAKGTFAWVEPIDAAHDHGSKQYAHRIRPSVRVVKTDDGFTFEGEWISDFGEDKSGRHVEPERIDLGLVPKDAVPPRPKELAPGAVAIPLDWECAPVQAR